MTQQTNKAKAERKHDKVVEDSFPASDPPANSGITGVGRNTKAGAQRETRPPSHARGDDARPTGTPNSDRHAVETAHRWEDQRRS